MGIWQRILGMAGANRNVNDDRLWVDGSGQPLYVNYSVNVTSETVQQIPEVYSCLKILSEDVGNLPIAVFSRRQDGSKERWDDHPIADLLTKQPNPDQDACEFRKQMTWDLCLHNNAFAEILGGRRGPVDQLVRIDPLRVQVLKSKSSDAYVYEVYQENGTHRRVLPENMFHLRGAPFTSDNLMGRSLIQEGKRVFAMALGLEDYARRFFDNDATPGGVVRLTKSFKTKEDADEYRRRWQHQFTGANRHSIAILDAGGEFQTVNVPNDKAQFIETQKQTELKILRFWRMPPHKVGILDRATFSNIYEQSLAYVIYTLMSPLVAWEKAIRRQLITQPRFFAEHNVAGLLRGDILARYRSYAIGRQWGFLSVNDIKKKENENPIPDGDVYLQPLNMGPAGQDPAQALASVTPQIIHALEDQRALKESL